MFYPATWTIRSFQECRATRLKMARSILSPRGRAPSRACVETYSRRPGSYTDLESWPRTVHKEMKHRGPLAWFECFCRLSRSLWCGKPDCLCWNRYATAFGTRKGQKRSGKEPEKIRQRYLFSIYKYLDIDYLEKYFIVV